MKAELPSRDLSFSSTSLKRVYSKRFTDPKLYRKEVAGHRFFSAYYDKLPELVQQDPVELILYYEKVSNSKNHALTDYNVADIKVNLTPMLAELAQIANKYAKTRKPQGGSVMFFRSRMPRFVRSDLRKLYAKFASEFPEVKINGCDIKTDPELLNKLRLTMLSKSEGLCVPSQGDLHERNIFASGHLVDFEGAGWNLLSTDIANFVHHILVGGNYYGPKYGKWARDRDRVSLALQPKEVFISDGAVTIRLNEARKSMLDQFKTGYIEKLKFADKNLLYEASLMTAVRLLTVFNPVLMSKVDAYGTFALANYFADSEIGYLNKISRLTTTSVS